MMNFKIQNIPKRYFVIFLLFITDVMDGYILSNMSMIIVDVTSEKRILHGNETQVIKAEFDWTRKESGLILGINTIGAVLSSLSGPVVHKIGGAKFLVFGKLMEGICSFSSPFVMKIHLYAFMALRIVLGFFEGLSFIGIVDVFTHWAPPCERVRLVTYIYLGFGIGHAISYPVSGYIIHSFGWPYAFYVPGAVIIMWTFIWIALASNDPSTDKFITEKERIYLSQEIHYKSNMKIPFKSIFSSMPVYAWLNEMLISAIIFSFTSLLPLYIKDVYNMDILKLGLISSIPELTSIATKPFFACFADYLRMKPNGCGITKLHKIFVCCGHIVTIFGFFLATVWKNTIGCFIVLVFARVTSNFRSITSEVVYVDIGGQYAAFLQSMAVVIRCISHFMNPMIIAYLVPNHTQSEWNTYFVFIGCMVIYAVIFFLIFGSGELQPWAKTASAEVNDKITTNKETCRGDKIDSTKL